MKIAIEAQRIFRRNKHGMDFVALETIRHLQLTDKKNEYYIYVKPGPDRCLLSSANFYIIELRCPSYFLWEQIALPFAISKLKPDVLHCTGNTAPLLGKTPLMVTLHDIIFLETKTASGGSLYQQLGRIYRRLVVPRIISKCNKIITVSDYEKAKIQTRFPRKKEAITRIYNGLGEAFNPEKANPEIIHKYIPIQSYLFFLGNTDPKKNTPNVLKAYEKYLKKSKQKRPLLIADLKEEWIDTILNQEQIQHIKPYLVFPGYINHADLPAIYAGAFVFLYPSLRESFGLPLLEAMSCGTPVITSITSALPEIAGEEGLLVDPSNIGEITEQLILLETQPEYYKKQVNYGLNRSRKFSWHKTAEELLKIYQTFK